MANFNKVFLMGNLTRDPELRYTQAGRALVKFGLAVNRRYRSQGSQDMKEETCFIDVEGWGNRAETFNQYMRKGRPAFIEGRLRFDSWETKDGQKRNKLVVVMENFQFLSSGGGGGGGGDSRPRVSHGKVAESGGTSAPAEDYDFDDIPF
jgi:single-strand DNA-binding protein